jgi:SpoVK/Ycf46/Vps4 family AAA+-type ATPase
LLNKNSPSTNLVSSTPSSLQVHTQCTYIPTHLDKVSTRFDDIGALQGTKQALYEIITLPLHRPDLYSTGINKDTVSGVLLFGAPGTGKTMLAKAVAAESGFNFITVTSSTINDMYVGEGEKNVSVSVPFIIFFCFFHLGIIQLGQKDFSVHHLY